MTRQGFAIAIGAKLAAIAIGLVLLGMTGAVIATPFYAMARQP